MKYLKREKGDDSRYVWALTKSNEVENEKIFADAFYESLQTSLVNISIAAIPYYN